MILAEATALVTMSTAALSDPRAALDLCFSVATICNYGTNGNSRANSAIFGAAGVIPAILSAMSVHAFTPIWHEDADLCSRIAKAGCLALGFLAVGNPANADAIVLSDDGLKTILSVMTAYTGPGDVHTQMWACTALRGIARAATPVAKEAMRASRAAKRLNAVRMLYSGHPDVVLLADDALLGVLTDGDGAVPDDGLYLDLEAELEMDVD